MATKKQPLQTTPDDRETALRKSREAWFQTKAKREEPDQEALRAEALRMMREDTVITPPTLPAEAATDA